MKLRIVAYLQIALMLLMCVPAMALANTPNTTLSLSKTTASVNESVTASGTTEPNAWVPLKVVDAAKNILYFDTAKSDATGNYSIDFIVPADGAGTLTVVVGEGSNVDTQILTVTGTPPADTEAPVWTNGSLTASDVGRTTLTLSWSGASDNVGVTAYKIYQDGTLLNATLVAGTSYNITGLTAATSYTFKVEAGDAAGNCSTDGPQVTTKTEISTSGGGGGGGGGGSSSQAVTSTTGVATVEPGAGGTISLGSEATIGVPANALTGTSAMEVKVQKLTTPPVVPAGYKLAGSVYEFSVGGKNSYSFAKEVTIKLSFDPGTLSPGETPAIHYFDEARSQWVNIGGVVSGNTITVQVDHFTKFAVLVAGEQKEQTTLKDIAGHWAANNINQLVAGGVISGYPDGSFKPNNTITRAEFATVLVKAFQLTVRDGKIFADTAGHWARDYIAAAADSGVVNGYDVNTFGPDDLITREQMAVMIVKAAKLAPGAGETQFTDSGSISDWAKEAVITATENRIMKGYPDNTIQPRGSATRAEAVTVVVNSLSK
ncbi:MAG: S-layer protein precursor [Pelotomaculum sp. PtaB.Bin104]|nr:MAG: S-layer protein precursor [Pelotomaculum sp. PtaB.Bin104]